MWIDYDKISDPVKLFTDENGRKCWILLAKEENGPDTLYVWCDPKGKRVLGFGRKRKAEQMAEVLATHNMVTWLQLIEKVEDDHDAKLEDMRSPSSKYH